MISDRDLASLQVGIYQYPGVPPVTWDRFDLGATDGVCWALKVVEQQPVIVLRGSTTLEDWFRDFDCVAEPWDNDDGLGPVHPGFYRGTPKVCDEISTLGLRSSILVGHSLGAGRACILTGLLVRAGNAPARLVGFGCPRPGFATLAGAVSSVPQKTLYRTGDDDGHDLVSDVPFCLSIQPYVQVAPLTPLVAHPAPADPWSCFRYHHAQLYLEALS